MPDSGFAYGKGPTEFRPAVCLSRGRSFPSASASGSTSSALGGRLAQWDNKPPRPSTALPSDTWTPGDPEEILQTYGGISESGSTAWYRICGWDGVFAGLAVDSRLSAQHLREVMWEAVLFDRFAFVPEWCSYKAHWYFRPQLGRRPGACILHQRAARQARWRSQPATKLKQQKRRGVPKAAPRDRRGSPGPSLSTSGGLPPQVDAR
jgi:hypothetical protein